MDNTIHILGGGPAGLATAYYAKIAGLNFHVYEANQEIGGNCRTIKLDEFRFDTGAHRVHDKNPEITNEIKRLLGTDLLLVDAPSQIFMDEKFFNFPLQLKNLFSQLSIGEITKIVFENILQKHQNMDHTFSTFALKTYGPTLANMFLLNYSKKLWGIDSKKLLKEASGRRMKGLTLKNFIKEWALGEKAATEHIDGTFYYPKYGIGMVMNKIADSIGSDNISTGKKVSEIRVKDKRVVSFTLNSEETINTEHVINTLPLTLTTNIIEPKPDTSLLTIANDIKYRNIALCVVGLSCQKFTPNASLYFPDSSIPFTRIYEPKNRSEQMAPKSKTLIVVECPCSENDDIWSLDEQNIRKKIEPHLNKLPFYQSNDVIFFKTFKIPYAYPVLEIDKKDRVEQLINSYEKFENMSMVGRSALFRYTHIHDHMTDAKNLIDRIINTN